MTAQSPADAPRAIIAGVLLSCIGVLAVMVAPVLVSVLVAGGMDPRQAGQITAAELFGTALACITAAFWIARLDWRLVASGAIVVVIAGNVLSTLLHGWGALLVLRFATGFFGEGTAFAIAMSVLGTSTLKERNFAWAIAAQVIVGVLAFQLTASGARWGVSGVLLPVAGFAALALLVVPGVPHGAHVTAGGHGGDGGRMSPLAFASLAVMLAWCTGLGAVWNFIVAIGVSAGLAEISVGQALGLSTLIGTSGALLASWMATRIDRLPAVIGALVVQAVMITLLRGEMPWLQFTVTAAVYQIFWNMTGPYLMGTIALSDTSGRASVLIPAAQIGGFSLGGFVVTLFLAPGGGYLPANATALVCFALAAGLFVPVALRLRRALAVAAA